MTRRPASTSPGSGGGATPLEGVPPRSGEALGELLAGAARGEAGAWEGIVRLYARRVFALAKSRCRSGDVAEEITQSVFATIAAKLGGEDAARGGYREQGKFEPWLFRVAMNRVRDHVRREKRSVARGELRDDLAAREHAEPTPEGELRRLRDAMGALSDSDREVVELRHHAQMSFQQIAELMNEPIGTLLARHHRALKKLREMLSVEDGGLGAGEPAVVRVRASEGGPGGGGLTLNRGRNEA